MSIYGTDNCYRAGINPITWSDAAHSCQEFHNSHLVVIDNAAEQTAISDWWMNNGGNFSVAFLQQSNQRNHLLFKNASFTEQCHFQQEAQLRNRTSAMHFFVGKLLSIAVKTNSYVYHLRNLCPANLLRIQRINFSMQPQHVCMTHDTMSFDVSILSRDPYE